jgi:lysophospholipase L1-like esterase
MKYFALLALFLAPWASAQDADTQPSAKPRFAKEIAKFVAADKANPPPQNALLLSGSSSARYWVSAAEDFKPYPVINRGFGGSKTTEVLAYMDQITLPYHPRVVIYFAGTNDLGGGATAEAVFNNVRQYVEKLRQENPNCGVIVMSALKSPKRKPFWAEFDKFNALAEKFCASGQNLYFTNHNPVMNKPNGEPNAELYREQGEAAMHASPEGYVQIVKLVRPIVDQAWKASEPKVGTAAKK